MSSSLRYTGKGLLQIILVWHGVEWTDENDDILQEREDDDERTGPETKEISTTRKDITDDELLTTRPVPLR